MPGVLVHPLACPLLVCVCMCVAGETIELARNEILKADISQIRVHSTEFKLVADCCLC